MKTENWIIENNRLVCLYETYSGTKGRKEFYLHSRKVSCFNAEYTFTFKEVGTNYGLGSVRWDNLTNCYTPLYNNTKLRAFIHADITVLKVENISDAKH